MSQVEPIFVPSLSKRGQICYIPAPPPQSLNDSNVCLLDRIKFPPVSGSQCEKTHQHRLEKGKFPSAPFVAFQNAALRVRPTPYRPQVTVAVINHIAAAVAAKVELPASDSLPRFSCPEYILREWTAVEDCIIQYEKVPNQSPHVDVSGYVDVFQL